MSSVHAIHELDIPCELIEVSWKRNENVDELRRTNPLGMVGTLVLDSGEVLTQNAAILEYLADQKPESRLLPASGTVARAHTVSWLTFATAELHQAFRQFFRAKEVTADEKAQEEIRTYALNRIERFLKHLNENLRGKSYVTGETFTIADCHLFVILKFSKALNLEPGKYPELDSYQQRIGGRPAIQKSVAV